MGCRRLALQCDLFFEEKQLDETQALWNDSDLSDPEHLLQSVANASTHTRTKAHKQP